MVPLEVGKAILHLDIVGVTLAILTDMQGKEYGLANHLIPTFGGRIGEDPRRNKSGTTIR